MFAASVIDDGGLPRALRLSSRRSTIIRESVTQETLLSDARAGFWGASRSAAKPARPQGTGIVMRAKDHMAARFGGRAEPR